jgi:hypothetical protein
MTAAAAVLMQLRPVEDRSVKAFGPDGQLRRKRYSQESARFLAEVKTVVPQWDRRGTKILCIHFYGESRTPVKNRLSAGTVYAYREQIESRKAWVHKRLPYKAVDAATGFVEPPQVLDLYIRRIFLEVLISIMANDEQKPPVTQKLAPVIPIDSGRVRLREKQASRKAAVVAFPVQIAA